MGGGGQSNSAQASQAASQQTAADQQQMAIAGQNAALQQRMVNTLFGNGSPGSKGTLSSFLDPTSLTSTKFNPAYQAQWNQDQSQIAKNYAQQRGTLAQSWANSGMGANNTPSGFQADQMRKLSSSEADTRGATYAGLKGSQYQDALNNFWNASNLASGNAATGVGAATKALGDAGSSSAQIYGTAGQYHPSPWGNVLGSAIGAGGAMGSAGITAAGQQCPAEGSQIRMADYTRKPIEELKKFDLIQGIDGKPDELVEDPQPSVQEVCEVLTTDGKVRVSLTHALVRKAGGYAIAARALGDMVETDWGPRPIIEVKMTGERLVCFHLFLKRSHSYNVDGFWSLE